MGIVADALISPPQRAWILIGDEASWPTPTELAELRREASVGKLVNVWTGPRQGTTGDLALFYFTAPTKAVCFIARFGSDAYWDDSTKVNAETPVSSRQWWVATTPPVQVNPIPYLELREASGSPLVLRGRSGKEVTMDCVSRLHFVAEEPAEQDAVDHLIGGNVASLRESI